MACTALIESSTVTTCSPPRCTSTSVRPLVGKIRAVPPTTTCERFSLVDTCTVSSQPRSAASVTSVSGVARTKLPPIPMKNLALPSRIASIAATVSRPCSRGEANANSLSSASWNEDGMRSKMPIVRSPWTLLCPRTGQTPEPGRPMFPWISRTLTISRKVLTECLCCVRPIAQHTTVRRDAANRSARPWMASRLSPVAVSTSSQSSSDSSAAYSS